jgi:hypothetical protein
MFVYIFLRRQTAAAAAAVEEDKIALVTQQQRQRDTWMCEIKRPERVLTLQRDDDSVTGFGLGEKKRVGDI